MDILGTIPCYGSREPGRGLLGNPYAARCMELAL
jgi:hypothetical protein